MREERPEQESLRLALAVVLARFLFGAAAGLALWAIWAFWTMAAYGATRFHMYHGTYPEWPFSLRACVASVLVCAAVGVLLPTIRLFARAVLNRLPFFRRYDWF